MAQPLLLDQHLKLTTCPPRPASSGLCKDMQSASPWGRTYLPKVCWDFDTHCNPKQSFSSERPDGTCQHALSPRSVRAQLKIKTKGKWSRHLAALHRPHAAPLVTIRMARDMKLKKIMDHNFHDGAKSTSKSKTQLLLDSQMGRQCWAGGQMGHQCSTCGDT